MTSYPIRKLTSLIICVLAVMPPAPAYAHAALIAATPAQSAIVQYQPTQIDLSFSEAITPVLDRIRVIGPDGQRWDAGPAQAEGTELRIPLTGTRTTRSWARLSWPPSTPATWDWSCWSARRSC
jgi:methionine-rich copper-binding protein CopC